MHNYATTKCTKNQGRSVALNVIFWASKFEVFSGKAVATNSIILLKCFQSSKRGFVRNIAETTSVVTRFSRFEIARKIAEHL